jgi:hypothetical protein
MLAFDIAVVRSSDELAGVARNSALAFIHQDLRAKRDSCAANIARGKRGLGEDIVVQVYTFGPHDRRADGFKVFASYAWLVGKGGPEPYQFDTLSSPAEMRLPPGYYVLWATDNQNKRTTPDPHYIDDPPLQRIELTVPR